ncbi:hypothetical protein [Azospirillum sp. sgz302134]
MFSGTYDAGTTSSLLDALLRALETLPGIDEAPWDLDCLRVALRIARATGAAGDLTRADLAFSALSPDNRALLLRHISRLAQKRASQSTEPPSPVPVPVPAQGDEVRSGPISSIIAALLGRPPPGSGVVASGRLKRDMVGSR